MNLLRKLNTKTLSKTISLYSQIYRTFSHKKLNKEDINYFNSILPKESIITEDLDIYNTDWMRKYKGNSQLVLKPKTTEEVSRILSYCNSQHLPVVPQGGNTGLVGGSVPINEEIILNLSKMNKIISFDSLTSTLHAEAGCVLENLDNFLNPQGFTMPLDLGAKGSCQIGGNLATNAGGIHFVRHGALRHSCKGLKAVLANGEIIDCLNPLPKNNTGYDLKSLFIGSEGTLGVITECLINTPARPKYYDLAMLSCEKFEDVLKIYETAKNTIPEHLYAIEFFDNYARQVQEKHGRKSAIEPEYPFYLLVEVASNSEDNAKIMEDFLATIEPADGVLAQDESQKKSIWSFRETIMEGASKEGIVLSYDISLPLVKFYEIVEVCRQLVKDKVGDRAKVIGYGHIGDYNLHLNVCYDKFEKDEVYYQLEKAMEPFVYDYLTKYRGSVSAEHGIGQHKSSYLNRTQPEQCINLMRMIKQTMDPNNILNPNKVFKFSS